MIVHALSAKGFMRYHDLELTNLSSEGVTAILGPNESGKSTIGDALTFILFGETVKSRETDISQLVSWDSEFAEVSAELERQPGEVIRIYRKLDRLGNQEARVAINDEQPTTGQEEVAQKIEGLLGFNFDEFRATFYLAQSETAVFHAGEEGVQSAQLVEDIVGVGRLRRATERLRQETPRLTRRQLELEQQLAVARALRDVYSGTEGGEPSEATDWHEAQEELVRLGERKLGIDDQLVGVDIAIKLRGDIALQWERLANGFRGLAAQTACEAVDRRLVQLCRAMDKELRELKKENEFGNQQVAEARTSVDRLIDYQRRLAELDASIALYRAEIRRRLEAPMVNEEDAKVLEDIALPATPAAALRVAGGRLQRLRASRKRSLGSAGALVVGALFAFWIGMPSAVQVLARKSDSAAMGISTRLVDKAVTALVDAENPESAAFAWLGFALGGCGIGLLLGFLALQQGRRYLARGEAITLMRDSVARLTKEVAELKSEFEALTALEGKRPEAYGERLAALRNRDLATAFDAIRDLYNDFVRGSVQREQLVARERAQEVHQSQRLVVMSRERFVLEELRASLPDEILGAASEKGSASKLPKDVAELSDIVRALLVERRSWRNGALAADHVAEGTDLGEGVKEVAGLLAELAEILGKKGVADLLDHSGITALIERVSALGAAEVDDGLRAAQAAFAKGLPTLVVLRAHREKLQHESDELRTQMQSLSIRVDLCKERQSELERRRLKGKEAESALERLELEYAPLSKDLEQYELAIEMLEETVDDVRHRVAPMLAKFASGLLPRLTGGRYRRVKVGHDLELRVYSPDKSDFVALASLSVGAADQLLLCLRLAVSAALLRSRAVGEEKHFLFLDEPMASFDLERAGSFLDILSQLGFLFPQVLLVAHLHTPGLEGRFVQMIQTDLKRRSLTVQGPGPGAGVVEVSPEASPLGLGAGV